MYVPRDALQSCKMRLPGVMHMEADLLDSIGDVWMSECEVL
jgi:hypothetical protein